MLQGKTENTLDDFFFLEEVEGRFLLIMFFQFIKDSWKEKTKVVSSLLKMKLFVGLNCNKHLLSQLSQLLKNRGTGIDQESCQIPSSACLKNEDACQAVYIQKLGEVLIKTACSPLWYYFMSFQLFLHGLGMNFSYSTLIFLLLPLG